MEANQRRIFTVEVKGSGQSVVFEWSRRVCDQVSFKPDVVVNITAEGVTHEWHGRHHERIMNESESRAFVEIVQVVLEASREGNFVDCDKGWINAWVLHDELEGRGGFKSGFGSQHCFDSDCIGSLGWTRHAKPVVVEEAKLSHSLVTVKADRKLAVSCRHGEGVNEVAEGRSVCEGWYSVEFEYICDGVLLVDSH